MDKKKITRDMLPKIKAPKWKVAGFILNEYELRCLLVEVGKGNLKSGILVTEMGTKEKAFILIYYTILSILVDSEFFWVNLCFF